MKKCINCGEFLTCTRCGEQKRIIYNYKGFNFYKCPCKTPAEIESRILDIVNFLVDQEMPNIDEEDGRAAEWVQSIRATIDSVFETIMRDDHPQ